MRTCGTTQKGPIIFRISADFILKKTSRLIAIQAFRKSSIHMPLMFIWFGLILTFTCFPSCNKVS